MTVEYDPFSPEAMHDPRPLYARLRADDPVHHVPAYDAWALASFEAVWQVCKDTTNFTCTKGMPPTMALLRERGVRPHVYVYGRPGMEDVEIARAVGVAEGFEVELFQKAAWREIGPEDYAEQVERNFHETDALVTDGGLFDNGGNHFQGLAR